MFSPLAGVTDWFLCVSFVVLEDSISWVFCFFGKWLLLVVMVVVGCCVVSVRFRLLWLCCGLPLRVAVFSAVGSPVVSS